MLPVGGHTQLSHYFSSVSLERLHAAQYAGIACETTFAFDSCLKTVEYSRQIVLTWRKLIFGGFFSALCGLF